MLGRKDNLIACKQSSDAFRLSIAGRVASVLTLVAVAVCSASPMAAADEPLEKADSALSHSAVPLSNRSLRDQLRRAEAMISRQEFPSAIAEIRKATATANSQILVNEFADQWQEYRDSHSVIESLLYTLPEDSLESYRRQVNPLAHAQFLKAVRASDFSMLRKLPAKFPLTDAARDSLRFLMAWHLDRQEFALAGAIARRLTRLPDLTKDHLALAYGVIELCDARSGSSETSFVSTDGAETGTGAKKSEAARTRATSQSTQGIHVNLKSELPIRAKLFPLLTRPDWQLESDLDAEAATLTRHALHEHFEQSIPILPRAQPLIVGDVVLRRSLTRISAHELATGQTLWSSDSVSEAGQSASRLTMNLSLQELMAQKLARGLQLDSLQSRLSSDGERVFTVESGGGAMSGRLLSQSGLLSGSGYQNQTRNRIVARRLRTGKIEWTLTADSLFPLLPELAQASDSSPGIGDVYFCGLPTPVDRNVVGLVQVGEVLRLYSADCSAGRVDWVIDVAEVARLSPADADWRSLDCRVVLVDGVLICPTGAGLVIGVDPGTRSVIWSRRYSRADTPLEVTRLPFASTRPQRPWWQGWRDHKTVSVKSEPSGELVAGTPHETGKSILVAAGPDAEGVNAIEPRTGRRLWSLEVESPIDLVSSWDRVLILGRHSITSVDGKSGTTHWQTSCLEPVGTGYTLSLSSEAGGDAGTEFYVFPARGGSLVAVNCGDGSMIESVDRVESLAGCLVSVNDRIVALNQDRLGAWPMLSAVSGRGLGKPLSSADGKSADEKVASPDEIIDRAVIERSCEMFAEAAARLRKVSDSPRAERELRKTLLAWIESGKLSSERLSEVESEAERLAGESSIPELINIRHAAAKAAVLSGEPAVALRFYAKLQSLNPSGEPRFLKPEPLRSVRHDRLIQGEVLDLFDNQDATTAGQLKRDFEKLVEAASESRDPFALQRFTRQWLCLPAVSKYALDDRARIGTRYGQKQLSLLALAGSSKEITSIEASKKLIDLYNSRRYSRDAESIRKTLLKRGTVIVADSVLKKNAGTPWHSGAVTVSEHSEPNLDTTFIPVPVQCAGGALFDRLNVAINPRSSRNDIVVRFFGDGISGSWKTVIPTASSPLKSVGRMYRGWGIGHLLILQLGAELFGISPFDGSGEPRVQRLWSLDMANGSRQEDHQYAPTIPGFSEEQLTMLDAFGRPIAKVGPVRAGYLCFQNRGRLVCLDPSTGQRLWQRYELPRQTICDGDGENVFLTQPREDRVTVLRAVDGATVKQFRLSDASKFRGTVLQAANGELLLAKPALSSSTDSVVPSYSQVALVRLRSESVGWSTSTEKADSVFSAGPDWIGILHETGKLRIVDRRSGVEISTCAVDRSEQVRAIHVASDASTHVIAFSNVADSSFLNGRPVDGGRNPAVTGQLVAIDASSAKLKWQRKVDRIRFLIDQPKNVPCILLSYRRSRSTGTQSTESVLHIINRETGDDILKRRGTGSASSFTFEPHADQNRLSIRMARQSIRLTFSKAQTP